MEQQIKMQEGEDVPGKPGEPLAHRYTHSIELRRLNDTMASEEFMAMGNAMDKDIMAFVVAMDKYRKDLAEHLRIDNLLANDSPEVAVAEHDAMQQAEQEMAMPRNNAVNVPTVSGNMGLPNQGGTMPVPNAMGGEQVAGVASSIV